MSGKKTYNKVVIFLIITGCFFWTSNHLFPKPNSSVYQDSPFGMHGAFSRPFQTDNLAYPDVAKMFSEVKEPYRHVQDIGVRWVRLSSDIYWSKVQPTREHVVKGLYDWFLFDILYGRLPSGVNILGTISVGKERIKKNTWQFISKDAEEKYIEFVKKVVDRYNGDAKNDMTDLTNPIKYWQIENEPAVYYEPRFDWQGFGHLVEITYKAIKEADPESKIALGGLAGGNAVNNDDDLFYPIFLRQLKDFYFPLLKNLRDKNIYLDIFDVHYYSGDLRWPSNEWNDNWEGMKDIYNIIRQNLDINGFKNTEIWFTETATMEKINGEKAQAASLVKRFVYPLSFGVKKIFWWNMIEGEFPLEIDKPANHLGLIYDGIGQGDLGYGVKKLSYYTYKKMVELLEGSDWGNIETIKERGGIYIYKFIRQGKPIWVAWNENVQPRRVVITLDKDVKTVIITDSVPKYKSGQHIANYATAFNTKTKSVTKKGVLTLTLGEIPLFVEEE